jgi:hypothetical protein
MQDDGAGKPRLHRVIKRDSNAHDDERSAMSERVALNKALFISGKIQRAPRLYMYRIGGRARASSVLCASAARALHALDTRCWMDVSPG